VFDNTCKHYSHAIGISKATTVRLRYVLRGGWYRGYSSLVRRVTGPKWRSDGWESRRWSHGGLDRHWHFSQRPNHVLPPV